MTLFGLDPQSVLSRAGNDTPTISVPTLGRSILLGTVGFTIASLVVYGSWALHGRMMYRALGEGGAYAVWAAVFIALAGGLLNPIVIGSRTLARFYALFAAAFTAYAILWSASGFVVRGRAGEWVGSFTGSAALALVLAAGFGLRTGRWKVVLVLFVLHSLGYFLGSVLYDFFGRLSPDHWLSDYLDRATRSWVSKLAWGFAHGAGLCSGLGYALYECQTGIRAAIRRHSSAVI